HLPGNRRNLYAAGGTAAAPRHCEATAMAGLERSGARALGASVLAVRAPLAVRTDLRGPRLGGRGIPAGVLVLGWADADDARDPRRPRLHARRGGLRIQASESGARLVRLPRDLPHRHGDRLQLPRRSDRPGRLGLTRRRAQWGAG